MARMDHHLLVIRPVADENDLILRVVGWNRIERFLDRFEVTAAVLRDDEAGRFGRMSRLDVEGEISVAALAFSKDADLRANPPPGPRNKRAA